MYSDETLDQIRDDINLTEYVGNLVELTVEEGIARGLCPFHKEKTPSFTIFNDRDWYCFGCGRGGDIIAFVMRYFNLHFKNAVQKLLSEHGIDEGNEIPEIFRIMNKSKPKTKPNVSHIILASNIMDDYHHAPIEEWLREGISQEILDKYKVRYDKPNNRIVFPIYDKYGNIINIKGRTLYENWKQMGLVKYQPYYSYHGGVDFVFPIHMKRNVLIKHNEVIVWEAEKSVMKADTAGLDNTLAIGASALSPEQMKLLLELKVNIVLALDKGLDEKLIMKQADKLAMFTNVYIIRDKKGLLAEKDSPIDAGIDVFKQLYEEKERIRFAGR